MFRKLNRSHRACPVERHLGDPTGMIELYFGSRLDKLILTKVILPENGDNIIVETIQIMEDMFKEAGIDAQVNRN